MILLVEDDHNLSFIMQDYLELLNYNILIAKDGQEGLEIFKANPVNLCILDVMLPLKDGFTLAKEIRAMNSDVPIIFLTAKVMKEDRISGFRAGCDDYITKPFSTEELELRIQAILKRCMTSQGMKGLQNNGAFNLGKYEFDHKNMLLKYEEQEKVLTRKENALLKLLCENKNHLVTREYALKAVWGDDDYFIGRSMDVFIAKLRKYLKADPAIAITNVHGTGFKLEIKDAQTGSFSEGY